MQLAKAPVVACLCRVAVRPTCQRAPPAQKPPRYTKSTLPSKVCQVCGRPFEWRKKWASVWADVKYCSERCRRQRSKGGGNVESTEAAGS